jgi:hypothetical protein
MTCSSQDVFRDRASLEELLDRPRSSTLTSSDGDATGFSPALAARQRKGSHASIENLLLGLQSSSSPPPSDITSSRRSWSESTSSEPSRRRRVSGSQSQPSLPHEESEARATMRQSRNDLPFSPPPGPGHLIRYQSKSARMLQARNPEADTMTSPGDPCIHQQRSCRASKVDTGDTAENKLTKPSSLSSILGGSCHPRIRMVPSAAIITAPSRTTKNPLSTTIHLAGVYSTSKLDASSSRDRRGPLLAQQHQRGCPRTETRLLSQERPNQLASSERENDSLQQPMPLLAASRKDNYINQSRRSLIARSPQKQRCCRSLEPSPAVGSLLNEDFRRSRSNRSLSIHDGSATHQKQGSSSRSLCPNPAVGSLAKEDFRGSRSNRSRLIHDGSSMPQKQRSSSRSLGANAAVGSLSNSDHSSPQKTQKLGFMDQNEAVRVLWTRDSGSPDPRKPRRARSMVDQTASICNLSDYDNPPSSPRKSRRSARPVVVEMSAHRKLAEGDDNTTSSPGKLRRSSPTMVDQEAAHETFSVCDDTTTNLQPKALRSIRSTVNDKAVGRPCSDQGRSGRQNCGSSTIDTTGRSRLRTRPSSVPSTCNQRGGLSRRSHHVSHSDSGTDSVHRDDDILLRSIKDFMTMNKQSLKIEMLPDGTKRLVLDLNDVDPAMVDFSLCSTTSHT